MRLLTLMLTVSSLVFTGAALADDSAWRLFIADHSAPEVRAVDLLSGKELGKFGLEGPASLVASQSGRSVFAVQGDAGLVSVIDTGISLEDHGEHQDLRVSEPRLLGTKIRGSKPAHLVEHDRRLALFNDGDGRVDILAEEGVRQDKGPLQSFHADAPHHGLAVPMGRNTLVTVSNNGETGRPMGVKVVDPQGQQVGEVQECPGLHGEAASGAMLAMGCSTGILVARRGKSVPSFELLPYPGDFPEGSTSTLRGGVAFRYFVGNYGRDAVVLVTPDEEQKFRLVQFDTRRVDFAVDPVRSRNIYVFTEDGNLHLLDALSGEIEQTARVTEPYSMDGHWRDPRPRLAVAGKSVLVTDPLKGVVHVVDVETFKESRTISVEGRPFAIAVAGGSGVVH